MAHGIRILLLADTHLGFDLPLRPRVARRRRGHDFLANYAAALTPALAGEVDIVVHGGDVFDRPEVAPSLAYQVFEPLARVADRGIPVFLVPGNHERSRLPHHRFAVHPNVHVFDRARTFALELRGTKVAFSGLPFERRDVRTRFPDLLGQSDWLRPPASLRVLCLHQCVEGATVGPGDFTFRSAPDVIRARDIPASFAAVLSGHIHRQQVLTRDLRGRPLGAPVLYPGSIERTSIAEVGEPKGYMVVELGDRVRWKFRPLPARPMIVSEVLGGRGAAALESSVRAAIADAPQDAVLRICLSGELTDAELRVLSAARLRRFAPEGMNVEISGDALRRMRGPGVRARRDTGTDLQLQFGGSADEAAL